MACTVILSNLGNDKALDLSILLLTIELLSEKERQHFHARFVRSSANYNKVYGLKGPNIYDDIANLFLV